MRTDARGGTCSTCHSRVDRDIARVFGADGEVPVCAACARTTNGQRFHTTVRALEAYYVGQTRLPAAYRDVDRVDLGREGTDRDALASESDRLAGGRP